MWSRGEDGVGVVAAVAVDVGDGLVHPSTTFTLMMGARYSSDQSCSVAGTSLAPGHGARIASDSGQPRISTPLAAIHRADPRQELRRHATRHQQAFAGVAGAVLVVLALSATLTAMAMSQGSST
jgi:hypothetical protein